MAKKSPIARRLGFISPAPVLPESAPVAPANMVPQTLNPAAGAPIRQLPPTGPGMLPTVEATPLYDGTQPVATAEPAGASGWQGALQRALIGFGKGASRVPIDPTYNPEVAGILGGVSTIGSEMESSVNRKLAAKAAADKPFADAQAAALKTSYEEQAKVPFRQRDNQDIYNRNRAEQALKGDDSNKPPVGFRYIKNGTELEAIPGGPADLKLDLADQKGEALTVAAEQQASRNITKIDQALQKVGRTTTGLGGAVMGAIPGTSATDLDADIATIKANLGFSELQAMRQASPTGGALGQVAVRELDFLQSTVASLDRSQSPEQLKARLAEVRQHYVNWQKAVREHRNSSKRGAPGAPGASYPPPPAGGAGAPAPAAGGGSTWRDY